jgi:hypothetical protein
MYARHSVIRTRLDNSNYANSPAVLSDNGGLMDALNAAADTFIAPNTGLRGDGWATFLLGAMDSGSYATYTSALSPRMRQGAGG